MVKWFRIGLRTKWLWVRIPLQSRLLLLGIKSQPGVAYKKRVTSSFCVYPISHWGDIVKKVLSKAGGLEKRFKNVLPKAGGGGGGGLKKDKKGKIVSHIWGIAVRRGSSNLLHTVVICLYSFSLFEFTSLARALHLIL